MSERERWIVYPLLFFALGAAIRDKIIKEVRTDRLTANAIRCETISIVDPENQSRILAELSSTSTGTAAGAKRFGRLVLTDSDGREYFGLADDLLQMREIRCEGVSVIDPGNQSRVLAQLTSTQVPPAAAGAPPGRFGVLALNNQSYAQVFGLPTRRPVGPSPPAPSAIEPPTDTETSESAGSEPPSTSVESTSAESTGGEPDQ